MAASQRINPGLSRITVDSSIMPRKTSAIITRAVALTLLRSNSPMPTGTAISSRVPSTKNPVSFSTKITARERATLPV